MSNSSTIFAFALTCALLASCKKQTPSSGPTTAPPVAGNSNNGSQPESRGKPVSNTAKAPNDDAKQAEMLLAAVKKGDLRQVRESLTAGANPDLAMDARGGPLHWAAYEGNEEMARALISAGANIESRNIAGMRPLGWACQENHVEIVRLLLDAHAEINWQDHGGVTTLQNVAGEGHLGIVDLLISKGADVNSHDGIIGNTPLHQAADRPKNLAVVQALVKAGASVNVRNKHGWTPLHNAAASGGDEIVRFLLTSGAEVDARSEAGATPLFLAVYNQGTVTTIETLLDAGANPNSFDNRNMAPLTVAMHRNEKSVELLKARGAHESESGENP